MALAAKGEENAEGVATEATTRGVVAVAVKEAGVKAVAASRTDFPAERGGPTKKPKKPEEAHGMIMSRAKLTHSIQDPKCEPATRESLTQPRSHLPLA